MAMSSCCYSAAVVVALETDVVTCEQVCRSVDLHGASVRSVPCDPTGRGVSARVPWRQRTYRRGSESHTCVGFSTLVPNCQARGSQQRVASWFRVKDQVERDGPAPVRLRQKSSGSSPSSSTACGRSSGSAPSRRWGVAPRRGSRRGPLFGLGDLPLASLRRDLKGKTIKRKRGAVVLVPEAAQAAARCAPSTLWRRPRRGTMLGSRRVML